MEGKGGMMIKVLVSVQSEIVRLNFELGLDEYMGICSSQSFSSGSTFDSCRIS